MNLHAILVEDDQDQADVSAGLLSAAGFAVAVFFDVESAQTYLQMIDSKDDTLIDLVVLDRRLPIRLGEPIADEVGDDLFRQVEEKLPDSRIIVFTGHSNFEHIQQLLEGRGTLPISLSPSINRVSVFRK